MWWAASIIFVRLISVSILANRSPRQWRRGTRIIAGAYKNCCRSRCRRLNGSHQSDEGGHHEPYKVSLRGGAGTTVNCGATCITKGGVKLDKSTKFGCVAKKGASTFCGV